ncbi:class I SAM-dependent methyltransferase [Geobacter sp. SVR]|uniref:class I SAM-dependent DNA methyltransferase n=1 Tax=Geobacter sp. SVR TaxID=2495594 RepID=UPI00143F00F7|nr:class I SAM-dependent methyltransferase [Geobacter sp. SVR]BCS55960.1 putative methyltransferase YqeM [Geobacter sp. SVR]GCF84723.1 putative methyltransferase YqeM [Geobacter sp. SVR]
MKVFDHYARYYDLLYRDKDYESETEYIHALIQNLVPGARTVLNLGCGSGRHDRLLAKHGYTVTGVDLSAEMLSLATASAIDDGALEYIRGDVRTITLGRQFDVVVSLFHVMSYQTANEDLLAAFTTAYKHVKPAGGFIFDCWYGPGVLTDRPAVRVKKLEDADLDVTRIASPMMHPQNNLVDVDYLIFIRNKINGRANEIRETHHMRYLFEPELRLMLKAAGFDTLHFAEWMTNAELDFNSWNAVVTAKASSIQEQRT